MTERAQSGDIVRNLTTGRVGTVIGSTQFGLLIVRVVTSGAATYGSEERWERWNTEVLAKYEGLS